MAEYFHIQHTRKGNDDLLFWHPLSDTYGHREDAQASSKRLQDSHPKIVAWKVVEGPGPMGTDNPICHRLGACEEHPDVED